MQQADPIHAYRGTEDDGTVVIVLVCLGALSGTSFASRRADKAVSEAWSGRSGEPLVPAVASGAH